MSAIILDGKKTAKKIRKRLKEKLFFYREKGIRPPGLAVVIVGNDPSSQAYVRNKEIACKKCGFYSQKIELEEKVKEEEVLKIIEELNKDEKIDGILIQLPLPVHINKDKIINAIHPLKDVDGFTLVNMGKLFYNDFSSHLPCTPKGIISLLEEYQLDITGKKAVVLGRSTIVGKPLSLLLLNKNATVTVCHSKTQNIEEFTKEADVIVAAVGKANFLKAEMIKEGSIIIDVGINVINGKICGDADFENIKEKAGYLTPVPGGIGPMTIAALLENTFNSYKIKIEKGANQK